MAEHNSEPRPPGSRIRHVIIHTNQGPNPPDVFPDLSAERLKAYLDRTDHDPVSYQVLEDDDSEIIYIPDDMMSYSARAANPISLNLCFLGYAEWSREEWLAHPHMLARAAAKVKEWCVKYSIPTIKLTPRDVSLKFWGIIGHADWTYAMKMLDVKARDSHTDPGESFPWDVFLSLINGVEEDEMRIDNHQLRGKGGMVLLYPIGSAGSDNIEAWVSASTVGLKGKGFIRIFAQGDTGGKQDWTWDEKAITQSSANLVRRPVEYLKDGVTKLVVDWDLSNADHGGVLTVEYRKRPKPAA